MVLVGQREDKMIFTESGTCLQIVKTDNLIGDTTSELFFDTNVKVEVIGNIYDNDMRIDKEFINKE